MGIFLQFASSCGGSQNLKNVVRGEKLIHFVSRLIFLYLIKTEVCLWDHIEISFPKLSELINQVF